MSLVGKQMVEFTSTAYKDGKFITITDKDVKGKWAIFCFYPADFSFVCPTELGDLQEQYETLQSLGVEVYSVSTDTHFVHKAWHDDSDVVGKITYAMIGDPSHELSTGFDVLGEDGLAQRGTFIIDPDGVIQMMEINAGGIGRDASTLIDKVRAAQYVRKHPNEVCPAKWKEGDDTLAPSIDLVGKI
ncbi:alkyl hydroperoxide reductase subunit C [Streptococcus zalophi]|uniref:Alkyl hydroperoxide reductase C n=1 Tax=Streptococcus zalophi TaxID=640031 RepID=A0A934PA52_9STRE|nr:alkyl hydroperoxide reductase subunit C [Streptococcus zalophi]MBJ8349884.1 peroxiredoxin [Streptococcus zalophi]MCR8967654.1 alkyl hydroperoxide reductase subunit C [Streptococcus zalophi]